MRAQEAPEQDRKHEVDGRQGGERPPDVARGRVREPGADHFRCPYGAALPRDGDEATQRPQAFDGERKRICAEGSRSRIERRLTDEKNAPEVRGM
jgi:hypothetical protein